MKTNLPSNVERGVTISFTFGYGNGYIELVLDKEQKYPYNGWSIYPHTDPVCSWIVYNYRSTCTYLFIGII